MPDQYIDAEKLEKNIEAEKPELKPEMPETREKEPAPESPTKAAEPPPTPSPPSAPLAVAPSIEEDVRRLECGEHHEQIQGLVDIAFQKGLDHAIEVAGKLNNPHLLDEFHDILIDELYNKLVERGKLKKL